MATTVVDTSNLQSTKSSAEVRAEAIGVAHSGEVTRFNDVVAGNALSRAQVQAEAREALRLGLLPRSDVDLIATTAQLEQIRMAGLRAIAEARWPAPTDRARSAWCAVDRLDAVMTPRCRPR